jgi:adenosylcobinamide-GDP ribazoletransferase
MILSGISIAPSFYLEHDLVRKPASTFRDHALMMKRQIKLFLIAVQFLTRLPTPQFPDFEPGWLSASARYFPLAGGLIGAAAAAIYLTAAQFWNGFIPALLTLAAAIILTGALHEDGLADFCDCFGARTREARLAIMKDSRIGAYGVLALALMLGLKASALAQLSAPIAAGALIAAHAGGRLAALIALAALPYAGNRAAAKAPPLDGRLGAGPWLFALACGLLPALLPGAKAGAAGLMLAAAAALTVALIAKRLIGGVTGDVLGATEQVFETGFLLGAASCA